jgi:hypothetical protein
MQQKVNIPLGALIANRRIVLKLEERTVIYGHVE